MRGKEVTALFIIFKQNFLANNLFFKRLLQDDELPLTSI